MKILVLSDTGFTYDPRIIRECVALQNVGHDIQVVCAQITDESKKGVYRGIKYLRAFDSRIFNIRQRRYIKSIGALLLQQFDFDVIHCHNEAMLNLAVSLKRITKAKIVYDSHELFHAWPLNVNTDNNWLKMKSAIVRYFLVKREKRNSRYLDYCITVCNSLADDLHLHFALKTRPVVLRNVPEVVDFGKKHDILRSIFHISSQTKIFVFIGTHIYPKSLNLEQVIDEVCNKKDIALVFICADDSGKTAIEDYAATKGMRNIYFHPLIKPENISAYLASANVGLVPTWNKNDLSYWYALDNKLFEYMMAGIPVVATQQPEYKSIIGKYNYGICINPDIKDAYYKGFLEIIDKYSFFETKTVEAQAMLNWNIEQKLLLDLYKLIETQL